ncbi:esterase [Lithospermum erythrorhizon]|uniref:Esterase n=1 Tax=Lithospermum erythrorhizon TaxID=34254 RepID=A0AAV3PJ32_LITER
MKPPKALLHHQKFESLSKPCINNYKDGFFTHISSRNHPKIESFYSILCNSRNQLKPNSTTLDSINLLQKIHSIRSFSGPPSDYDSSKPVNNYKNGFFKPISSRNHQKIESFYSILSNSRNQSKPNSTTLVSIPMLQKFHSIRSFSGGPSDSDSCKSVNAEAIDAGSSIRKPISLWPGMYHSPVTNALWDARSNIFERLSNASAPSQSELITKPPSKSRTCILYQFSDDYVLREQYRNPWNEIRMGKLLEDLDALAGTISFKHCSGDDSTTRPLILVTASVDRMVLSKPINVDADLKIEGAVTWVGRSSMEIQLEVSQSSNEPPDQTNQLALTANFTFVARDSKTGKSAPINQILPESEKEKLLWEEAEERNKMRKMKRLEQKRDKEGEEVNRVNGLLAEGRIFSDMPALADRDSILIQNTSLQNSLICQPQQRNIHGRIFGGFLMRRAFELAFATAYAFAGSAPCFLEVDHVDFLKPVDVGNFLRFKSCVLYTELENPTQPLINVEVVAHVTLPELRSSEVSNKFYFTFGVRPEAAAKGPRIRNVVPATEEEARRVIERIDAERALTMSS